MSDDELGPILDSTERKPSKTRRSYDLRALIDTEDYPMTKLLEAINLRASLVVDQHNNFPQMDLTALYCLGVTIQEYARYLNTDVITEKRAIEGAPILPSVNQSFDSILPSLRLPHFSATPLLEPSTRPNLEEDIFNANAPERRTRRQADLDVRTNIESSEYDRLLELEEFKQAVVVVKSTKQLQHESEERRIAAEERKQARIEAKLKQDELEKAQLEAQRAEATLAKKRDAPKDIFDSSNSKKKKQTRKNPPRKKNTQGF